MSVPVLKPKAKIDKECVESYLKDLRLRIINAFNALEQTYGNGKLFVHEDWSRLEGGGGTIGLLRGSFFEKAAVNFSSVSGDKFPGDDASGPFYATGVSLITHMKNPKIPTFHFNVRYIETPESCWFGGGFDITPMGFVFEEDTKHFHSVARRELEGLSQGLYDKFCEAAKQYFFIKHRNKERGQGGIFFDHLDLGDIDLENAVFKTVAESFLPAVEPILTRRASEPFSPLDIERQLEYRGHYAEFNLVYDRGTRFGFLSGGNTKAILCSLPPLAAW